MEDLIRRAADITGVDEDKARKALASALALMKKHADPARLAELFSALPGAQSLAAEGEEAPAAKRGFLGGMMKAVGGAGGAAMADALEMGKRLNAQGVSNESLQRLLPAAQAWVKEKTGRDLLGDVLASIPGLGGYFSGQSKT